MTGTSALYVLVAYAAIAATSPNYYGLIVIVSFLLFAVLAGALTVLILKLLKSLPVFYAWVLGSVLVFLVPISFAGQPLVGILTVVISCSLAGAGIASLAATGWSNLTKTQRGVSIGGVTLGFGAIIFVVVWLSLDGHPLKQIPSAARTSTSNTVPIALPDPSTSGTYPVKVLTYGSGRDRRPEFGSQVTLRTNPVDGSKLIERWSGRSGWVRTRYWGFDVKHLPIQGRVWYPQGDGPFPLVLIVHGNHTMEEFSDPGYAYLGELMASRGFIFVSVDENFLNSSFTDLIGIPDVGLKEENDARGWMLLEHLKVWRQWNKTAGVPFQGRVDTNNIALMGHSRGGEAVTIAAVFNRLPFYPDDARVHFDYNFGLRSVVAIAPVDGQYKPAGTWTHPENINYFVLHGSLDADVQSFHGSRVYERIRFTDGKPWFKSTLYTHGANHGQFNSVWGRTDAPWPFSRFLNLKAIIPAEDQRKIAKVFISAFLEATLHGNPGYRLLFRDYRAGSSWVPDLVYLQKYEDSSYRYIATYEEDIDLQTTTLPGGRITTANLSDWKERELQIKWGSLDTHAVYLGWNADEFTGEASYTIQLPDTPLDNDQHSVLVFALAAAKDKPTSRDEDESTKKSDKKSKQGKKPEVSDSIDLTLEISDTGGAKARLPLSRFSLLQPQVESQVPKAAFMSDVPKSEVVFQSFEFPLSAFLAANPRIDPARLRTIRWIFDRTREGVIILDAVAFRRD